MALAGAGVANAAWSGMDPLQTGRYNHTATVLADGRVLVAGGTDNGPLASARLYDPKANAWSAAGSMNVARHGQAAALLADGKVLVAGGFTADANSAGVYTETAEIYDPQANAWTKVASMSTGRFEPTMTMLKNGRVLVAGGVGDIRTADGVVRGVPLDSAEIYDPAANTWTAAAAMSTPRALSTATRLPDGKVLVAGGHGDGPGVLDSAELYDPAGDSWSATGALAHGRDAATATSLRNGDVLVAGGNGADRAAQASAEIYSADSGSWHAAASMAGPRSTAAAALLTDGTVLVAGGEDGRLGNSLATTELYDPARDTWTDGGTLAVARAQLTLSALGDGRALVVGGNLGGFAAGSTDVDRFSAVATGLTPLTFGTLPVGTASDAKTATLTNTGKLPLVVGAVTIAGGAANDYAIVSDTCHDSTVAPGDSCTIDVRFTPGAEGARNATLTVADNTAAGTTIATLAGSGPAPAAPAAPADGGNQGDSAPAAPAAPAAPSAGSAGNAANGTGAGTAVAPSPGIAVDAEQAQHHAAARATCKVSTARSHGRSRSTVTCVVAWPTNDKVALRGRLLQGKRVVAGARATARGGRAVLRLRAAGRLRAGRYTVAITRSNGSLVLSRAVRAR